MNSIVIGSGFGGIATALRLRAKGHQVTIIEKHPDLGGRARVFKKGDFTYDGGPTVITAPYLFEELFSLFNKKISDYVKIIPLDLWYRFVFNDGETFDYSGFDMLKASVDYMNEAEYQGKKVSLNKPKRGGSKKFYVYVKSKKGNVKKVSFGDTGLSVKLKQRGARASFAARHKCSTKKDKTKAGYWSCNIGRYWKSLGGGSNFSGYW